MKIQSEHYEYMRLAMSNSKHLLQTIRQNALKSKVVKDAEKRIRWDLMHSGVSPKWICDNIYPYADDTHIDTALRQIMKEIEAS